MFIAVNFHADGGVACVTGRRVFSDRAAAEKLAGILRAEPDHNCGPESVTITEHLEDPGNEGKFYYAVRL